MNLETFGLKFWCGIPTPVHLDQCQGDLDSQGNRVRTITPSVPLESLRKQRALPPAEKESSGAQDGRLGTKGKEKVGEVGEEKKVEEVGEGEEEEGEEREPRLLL